MNLSGSSFWNAFQDEFQKLGGIMLPVAAGLVGAAGGYGAYKGYKHYKHLRNKEEMMKQVRAKSNTLGMTQSPRLPAGQV
jgi:hypothetical protein